MQRVHRSIQQKIFFRWFDGYFNMLDRTYRPYTLNLKRKVLKGFLLDRRLYRLQKETAATKVRLNYKCKVWLALLENLNQKK
jgi:hypothetical protein